jgi:hypothetical protein
VSYLILDRGNGFNLQLVRHCLKLPLPERADDRIGHAAYHRMSVAGIAEELHQRYERRPRCFQEREQAIAEDVFHPRAPGIAVDLLEGGEHSRCNERPCLGGTSRQRIEGDGMLLVSGIEQHHIIGAMGRDASEDRLGQVAMRIDETAPVSGSDIIEKQSREQSALPHAGLTDDVEMAAAIVGTEGDKTVIVPKRNAAERGGGAIVRWLRKNRRRSQLAVRQTFEGRHLNRQRGHVPERGQLLSREEERRRPRLASVEAPRCERTPCRLIGHDKLSEDASKFLELCMCATCMGGRGLDDQPQVDIEDMAAQFVFGRLQHGLAIMRPAGGLFGVGVGTPPKKWSQAACDHPPDELGRQR